MVVLPLEPADDRHDPALNLHIRGIDVQRWHGRMSWLEPYYWAFWVDAFQCGLVAVSQVNYGHLPSIRVWAPFDNEQIAAAHKIVDHGIALHLEGKELATGIRNVWCEFNTPVGGIGQSERLSRSDGALDLHFERRWRQAHQP
jgi:hypothetical protein